MLSTLLILADEEREDRTILTRPLAPTIFIAGPPRSGTTFLHGRAAHMGSDLSLSQASRGRVRRGAQNGAAAALARDQETCIR